IGYRLGTAKIGETQTDNPVGVLNALAFTLVLGLLEVITDAYFVIQQGEILVQRFFIELLLVE
ncbi:MAG: hypothetical protein GWO38_00800, partial [Phycisphaerae bacterium]|nr:hypothetical protein [Phycisphaerae bacterium]NIX26187.1 hypothetical protein [Phycisphaerae bacterium]